MPNGRKENLRVMSLEIGKNGVILLNPFVNIL